MKLLFRLLSLFFLPVLIIACEEGIFGEPVVRPCLEIRQEDNTGFSVERVYSDNRITEIRFLQNGELRSYYAFSYGSDGRISNSQYFNVAKNTEEPLQQISYDEEGRWVKKTIPYSNGDETTLSVVYDDQNQIKELTSSTKRAGVDSVNYTLHYTWEAGNNTSRTFSSPALNLVTQYEFDLSRENKRKEEQEKIAFLSTGFAHNKNMYRQSVYTVTTDSTFSETVSEYDFQYNEEGYPVQVTLMRTVDSGEPVVTETQFLYNCN